MRSSIASQSNGAEELDRRGEARIAARVAVATALLLVCAVPAGAAEFTVTTTADAIDLVPSDGVCVTVFGCSLRAAIQTANFVPGLDTILIPAGTYLLTRAGAGEDAAATGDLDVNDAVSIYGGDHDHTVIDGGGLDRVFEIQADATILDVTIRGGEVSAENGAGIFVAGPAVLTLRHALVENNHAVGDSPSLDNGGGIGLASDATLVAEAVEIRGNSAERAGGILLGEVASLDSVWIHDNLAHVAGGGLLTIGDTTLLSSTISANRAGNNSSALLVGVSSDVLVQNSTISGNAGEGGSSPRTIGFYGGTLTLENATIADNVGYAAIALSGAGPATVTLRNTIVSNDVTAGECDDALTIVSSGYNVDSDGSCAGTGPGDLASTDPLLLPLGNWGGDLPTQYPAAGSPAIDAGNPGGCTGVGGAPIATDQRGAPRPFDGDGDGVARCDIGAVEWAPEPGPAAAAAMAAAVLGALAAMARSRGARSHAAR